MMRKARRPKAYSVSRKAANGCCAAEQTKEYDGPLHEQAEGLLHSSSRTAKIQAISSTWVTS